MADFDIKSYGHLSVESIEISKIVPNPNQPRTSFDEVALKELAASIKQYGVLQPITVRKLAFNQYELIAGERRFRASQLAGFDKIPAIVIKASDEDSSIIAMVENVQRQNLNCFEEAYGYKRLVSERGFKQEEIAALVGKSQSAVANKLRLLRLPEDIQLSILANDLTERHARALLALDSEDDYLPVLRKVVNGNLNVQKTEELIAKTNEARRAPKEEPNHQVVNKYIKDFRLFSNSVRQAAKIMEASGFDVQINEQTSEDGYEITVKIPVDKD